MDAWNVVLNLLTLGLVLIGGWFASAIQSGLKTTADEVARFSVASQTWQARLEQELQQARGTERQELRFTAYGQLWSKMRSLAIYDVRSFGPNDARGLSSELSDWYFSETGGLLLTSTVREFYFALQALLRGIAEQPGWTAQRSDEDPKAAFERILAERRLADAGAVLHALEADATTAWPGTLATAAGGWRRDVSSLVADWTGLEAHGQFAVLQQVSSALRTAMVNDVESRLR